MAFSLRRGTLDDILGLLDIWYRSFNSPEMPSIFPDSPLTRAWVSDANATDMQDEMHDTVHMIVTDDEKNGKVVSLAKWVIQPAGGPVPAWEKRWPAKVAHDMSEEIVTEHFFEPMGRQHARATGDRAHYFLEVLATHDEYRQRGLASRLLAWVSDGADEAGVECYLDSMPAVRSLYEKCSYVQQPFQDEKASRIPMLRPVQMTAVEKPEVSREAALEASMREMENAA